MLNSNCMLLYCLIKTAYIFFLLESGMITFSYVLSLYMMDYVLKT